MNDFGVRKIELRWITEPREHFDEIDGRTYRMHARHLQYRTRQFDGWEQMYWTEWQDVPEIIINPDCQT